MTRLARRRQEPLQFFHLLGESHLHPLHGPTRLWSNLVNRSPHRCLGLAALGCQRQLGGLVDRRRIRESSRCPVPTTASAIRGWSMPSVFKGLIRILVRFDVVVKREHGGRHRDATLGCSVLRHRAGTSLDGTHTGIIAGVAGCNRLCVSGV